MTDHLFPVAPKLTDRQTMALAYLQTGGATARDVGVHLHLTREPQCKWCVLSGGSGCNYAGTSGQEVLRALRSKKLVVRRQKTGLWEPVGAKRPSKQTNELPPDF